MLKRLILLSLLMAMLFQSFASGSSVNIYQQFDNLSQQVNRSRGLALAVLKQIKQIDADCLSDGDIPVPGRTGEARSRLGGVRLLVRSFETISDDAEKLSKQLERDLMSSAYRATLAAELTPGIKKLKIEIARFRQYVNQHYNRAINNYGEPIIGAPRAAGLAPGKKLSISGEVATGLGSSQYKRPHANPAFKSSSTDFLFGVKGLFIPSKNTTVLMNLNHKKTVQRREIALTKLGASVVQNFTPNFTGTAGLDYSRYSDKTIDIASYGDLGMFGRVAFQKKGMRLDGQVRRTSRGYSDLDNADYSTTTLSGGATLPVGLGNVKLRMNYLSKSNDIDALNHTEFSPGAIWQFVPCGSEVGVKYQQFSHPEVDDSPLDNNRIKAHLHLVKKSGPGTSRWGPEVMIYKFPNDEARDYIDFKLFLQSNKRTTSFKTLRLEAAYRMYSDTSQYDFAQLQFRSNSRPIGSGYYSNLNLAARYYTESSNDDDALRFSNVHPPHTVDCYWNLGWNWIGGSWFQGFSAGPIFGTRVYLDTERSDAFDEDLIDTDFLLRNPQNTARAGLKVGISGTSSQTVTWRTDLSYVYSILYNADPMRTTNILELSTRLNYPIDDKWLVEGYAKIHRTRVEIESVADLNKSNVGVQVKYLFGTGL